LGDSRLVGKRDTFRRGRLARRGGGRLGPL